MINLTSILILFGGPSYEHDVSCLSAKTILTYIDKNKYKITPVGIDKYNDWYIYKDDISLLDSNWTTKKIEKIHNIISFLKRFDKVFPVIHGYPLESGHLQGLFDLFNIKYIGSNSISSIISYDKELTKIICNKYNIPQIPYITTTKILKNIPLEYPVIIKPAKCGSSIGINIASNQKELKKYQEIAFKYDNKIIIESYIKSRELECAVLKTNKIIPSSVGEIRSSNTFYDYEAKYNKPSSLIIPANIPKELSNKIKELSIKISNILSINNLARIDFLYDYNKDILYFNEINTMPGFTDSSMYPLLFIHDKISLKKLITYLLEN